jgi:hypothetical protein
VPIRVLLPQTLAANLVELASLPGGSPVHLHRFSQKSLGAVKERKVVRLGSATKAGLGFLSYEISSAQDDFCGVFALL